MKTGLLLVDIQNDYFPQGRMELAGMNEASSKAQGLLSLFRTNQWPVFHIQHIAAGTGAAFFLPDTDGVEIHDSVKPIPGETVIQKHFPSSFRDTVLLEKLKKAEVKRLVICGAMSAMCIDATTRAAFDLGFSCIVVHDACATRDLAFGGKTIPAEMVQGAFMAALGSVYARVLSFDTFLSRIKDGAEA